MQLKNFLHQKRIVFVSSQIKVFSFLFTSYQANLAENFSVAFFSSHFKDQVEIVELQNCFTNENIKTNWSYLGWKSSWMRRSSDRKLFILHWEAENCNFGKALKTETIQGFFKCSLQHNLTLNAFEKVANYELLTSLNHNFTNWSIFQISIFCVIYFVD